jgi:endonuclease/exonuclease/phosphatase family metal-dependent hydrolase
VLAAPEATPITIAGWNVESGGALQSIVLEHLAAFENVDVWGLSEVNAIDAEAFEFGAEEGEGANYESYLGTTGAADRLLLIWDNERFAMIDNGQLREIGLNGRAPLWVHLREQATGLEFMVMVNHLHRSNEATRHRQAQMLNAWAAGQALPVIALGDYNFDWNLPNGDLDHDVGYDNMVADGVWQWVRPTELVTTQCSGWPCGFNSVLDFVFVSGPAQAWNITSRRSW